MANSVFKITLPCSGKLSAEVDVQVLIQLSCLQPDLSSQAANNLQDGQQQADSNNSLNGLDQQQQATTFRTFSHTLAVRRKKICTQQAQPVPLPLPLPPQPAISAASSATQANNKLPRPHAPVNLGPAQPNPMVSTTHTQTSY